ncbi:host specificity factor TipJ family phage tail protein [Propionivibrio dicarboxylicus]|uniref:Phage-related protein, tail component n=1 Tax=Propionivibrio dicarboxylicus TaxID=83767 RepID=A0A1G8LEV5_9RHOO|nr:host specificity factor TipJ family phage tail protein [Propionivibrio dicarboxylicus]SDI54175.1 Phage-related protein, tail component [Propionivibrio dicarboxylicus]
MTPEKRSANVVLVRNPFERSERDHLVVEIESGTTIADLVRMVAPGNTPMSAAIDGEVITREEWERRTLAVGEHLSLIPILHGGGGNDLLRTVAMIGLMIAAPGIGAAIAGSMGLVGSAATAFSIFGTAVSWGTVIGVGVGMIGGMLVNALLPPAQAKLPSYDVGSYDNSATYSWSPKTTQDPGLPISKTYGTMRLHGNIIASYIEISGDLGQTQKQHLLIDLGMGPIAEISDIRINGQPIENYSDCYAETRLGYLDQEVISDFNDTQITTQVGQKVVLGTPVTRIVGTGADAIEVELVFPNGLYYYSDSGSPVTHSVGVKVEYAAGAGAWVEAASETISAASTKAVRRRFKIDNLDRGLEYKIRVSNSTADQTSSRYGDDCYLGSVTQIMKDDFAYPGTALLAIRALATDQLSGDLDVSCLVKGALVQVYRDGAWHVEYNNNPAWVSWDILTQPVIRNDLTIAEYEACDPEELILADFEGLAEFADYLVPGDGGVLERRCEFDGTFDTETTLWDAVLTVLGTAYSVPVPTGTRIGLIWDHVRTEPTQVFTVGNTNVSGFKETWLPMDNRLSRLEADFINRDLDWQRDPMTVVNKAMEVDGSQSSTISAIGITRPSQVFRFCMHRLLKNQHLRVTGEISVDVDALRSKTGDLVWVQCDFPAWGKGGRIVSGTAYSVELDQVVTLEAGAAYQIVLRLADDSIVIRNVTNAAGDAQIVNVSTPFPAVPGKYDVYAIGKVGRSHKEFIVTDVSRASDMKMRLGLIEYNASVFEAESGAPVVPTTVISDLTVTFLSASVTERIRAVIGGVQTIDLQVDFTVNKPALVRRYVVDILGPTGGWSVGAEGGSSPLIVPGVSAGDDAQLRIRAIGTGGATLASYLIGHDVEGVKVGPAAPTATAVGALFSVDISWTFNDARQDILATEVWFSATNNRSFATRLTPEPYPTRAYKHPGLQPGAGGYYWVRLEDKWGNYSAFFPASETGGLHAVASTDPSSLLSQLQGSLGMQQLANELVEPIAKIETIALDAIRRELAIDDLAARVLFERAVTSATVYVDPVTGKVQILATAAITTDVEARLTTVETVSNADHGTLQNIVATVLQQGQSLTSTQSLIEQLANQIALKASQIYVDEAIQTATGAWTVDGANATQKLAETAIRQALSLDSAAKKALASRARIALAEQTISSQATALAAESAQRLALAAIVDDQAAALTAERKARADAVSAEVQAREALAATVSEGDQQNAAAIETLESVVADSDSALAQSIENLLARLNTGDYASVKELAQATAEALGMVLASWAVQVDVNGKVAGIKLISDGRVSAFAVVSDRFLVYLNDESENPVQVFTLGQINGRSALILAADIIGDGSIIARHLSVDELSAISAYLGAIKGGSIDIGDGAAIIREDGSAYFSNIEVSRQLAVATGSAAGLAGTYAITPGEGWRLLATVTIDTGYSVGAWWSATDRSYDAAAGIANGSLIADAFNGNFGTFIAHWAIKVKGIYPRSRWNQTTTLMLELELWAQVDGEVYQLHVPAGAWVIFKVT